MYQHKTTTSMEHKKELKTDPIRGEILILDGIQELKKAQQI